MHDLFLPFRLKLLKKHFRGRAFTVLDVGCGSHSPTLTKRSFPECEYYGVDRELYGNDEGDVAAMERYFEIDLAKDDLSVIPDTFFDLIIMSHVIEHLEDGLRILATLVAKLRPGGRIYVEFPSERALGLPSMPDSLHFCDDPTHVRVYSVREIVNQLLARDFRIIRAGVRRDLFRSVTTPAMVAIKYVLRGRVSGGDFWDICGFASFVYAEKK